MRMRIAGQDIEHYARKYLFGPLGISHYYWKRTPKGVDTEGGLYLQPEDLAKLRSATCFFTTDHGTENKSLRQSG